MHKNDIPVPRWFLESLENTLRIQNNLYYDGSPTCQSRNVRGSLNGVRRLLAGEELTGMERLERAKDEKVNLPHYGLYPYTTPSDTLDGEIENIFSKLKYENKIIATKRGFEEIIHHFYNWFYMHLLTDKSSDL